MMIFAHFLGLALSATDICQTPSFDPDSDGGAPFCVVESETIVETPYYVVTIFPRVLVWLYDDGRTLSIESSVHQSQISLSITVAEIKPDEMPASMQMYGCPDVMIQPGTKVICDRTTGEYVDRTYVILNGSNLILIGLSAAPLAKPELSNYEAIINSIAATQ